MMAARKLAGLLISFEGIDFCGKTTQVSLLQEHLATKGEETVVVREPGGTEISEKIRRVLLDRENLPMAPAAEMLLYQASRAQLTGEVILPALEKGKIVLCDRYYGNLRNQATPDLLLGCISGGGVHPSRKLGPLRGPYGRPPDLVLQES
jgi:hypothetical protein